MGADFWCVFSPLFPEEELLDCIAHSQIIRVHTVVNPRLRALRTVVFVAVDIALDFVVVGAGHILFPCGRCGAQGGQPDHR